MLRFRSVQVAVAEGQKLANKWKKEGRERRSQGNSKDRENFLLVEGVNS